MTPREKILSIGVGLALTMAVGNYMLNSIRKGFKAKSDRIEQLITDVTRRDESITDGLMDRNKLNALIEKSLPTNVEQAAADYRSWLIDLIDETGLKSPKQSFVGETAEKGVYRRFKFQISGRGTVENLTRLLYAYYQKIICTAYLNSRSDWSLANHTNLI